MEDIKLKLVRYVTFFNRNKIVRLTDCEGRQITVTKLSIAFKIARERKLDLVEFNPNLTIPIYRIMNYNKFLYLKKKTIRNNKIKKIIDIKEIKINLNIEDKDYKIKLEKIFLFLKEGKKIKITIYFKGREKMYYKSGIKILEKIKTYCEEECFVESFPKELEGNKLIMVLASKLIYEQEN